MDVLVLIDKLDDLVHNAKPVPLTDQVRVDKEEIYDILDQMRATIPEEIKQARWIVKERQEMLAEAKREAERIVKEARERQDQLISQEEVTKQAERAAEDIIEDARAREREIRLGAEDYADEILNTLEVNLSKFIAAVQRGRERLQGKDEQPAEGRTSLASAGSFASMAAAIEVLDTDITQLAVARSPTRRTPSCCTVAALPARSRAPEAGGGRREPPQGADRAGGGGRDDRGRHAVALGHPRGDDAPRRPHVGRHHPPRDSGDALEGRGARGGVARARGLRHGGRRFPARRGGRDRGRRGPRAPRVRIALQRVVFAVHGDAAVRPSSGGRGVMSAVARRLSSMASCRA